jgi:uncharacterized RDD family membrane protein YckC
MAPLAGFWQRCAAQLIDIVVTGAVAALLPGLGWLLGLAYWVVFLAVRGQTIGMMALGIRIVRADDGGPLDWQRSLVRALMALVSGLCLGLGYLRAAWHPRRQTWQDSVAGTVAVQHQPGF